MILGTQQCFTLRLDGDSNRNVRKTLVVSRDGLNAHMKHLKACQNSLQELLKFENGSLAELLPALTTIRYPRFDELMG
ncbi:MAG: hypothetical protein R6V72_20475 [Cyclobacterium sp.]|uniref:hypothetical protein n=1 Tax=Cyclobacterium sp. TaxID=1966343 RepID=UPI003970B2F2